MRFTFLLPFALAGQSVTATADDIAVIPPVTYTSDMTFDDTSFAVENAIIDSGLIIQSTLRVGDMLARTKEDVSGNQDIFTDSIVYTFCSAKISRQVMEIDPAHLQFCPYGIFIYEIPEDPGRVIVGHRSYNGEVAIIGQLLSGIVSDALMRD